MNLFIYPAVRNIFFLTFTFLLASRLLLRIFLSDEMTFISEEESIGGWDWGFCAGAVREIPDGLLIDYELEKPIMPSAT